VLYIQKKPPNGPKVKKNEERKMVLILQSYLNNRFMLIFLKKLLLMK